MQKEIFYLAHNFEKYAAELSIILARCFYESCLEIWAVVGMKVVEKDRAEEVYINFTFGTSSRRLCGEKAHSP